MRPLVITSTAYHEAGHAAVAVLLGLDLRGVHIIAQTRSAGQTTLTKFGAHPTGALATFLLAGPEAEHYCVGRPNAAGAAADMELVGELLDLSRKDNGPPVAALIDRYRTLARAYVILHEDWIRAVAAALMRDKGLNAAAVAALRPRWEAR